MLKELPYASAQAPLLVDAGLHIFWGHEGNVLEEDSMEEVDDGVMPLEPLKGKDAGLEVAALPETEDAEFEAAEPVMVRTVDIAEPIVAVPLLLDRPHVPKAGLQRCGLQ